MVGRVIDSLIVFRILKMLTTPFEKTPAFKFGFIDQNGVRIKYLTDPDNPNQKIPNTPKTKEEKSALTPLHRLVFNLKKLIRKLPGGKSQLASYAVALGLLKEHTNLDNEQADQLFEDFYHFIKSEDAFTVELVEEAQQVGKLSTTTIESGEYHLRTQIKQNFDELEELIIYPAKSLVTDISEHSIGYGVLIYEGYIDEDRVLFTAEDVY
jgi:hypothetical protein